MVVFATGFGKHCHFSAQFLGEWWYDGVGPFYSVDDVDVSDQKLVLFVLNYFSKKYFEAASVMCWLQFHL